MSDLQTRFEAFDELSHRTPCERPSKLISTFKIEPTLWEHLKHAAALYVSKCLPGNKLILDEHELLANCVKHEQEIKNLTPNGMLVPKRHTILEYNALVQAYAAIIRSLKIDDLIVSWHVPLNLRIKFGEVNQANLKRHHPTEDIHSDSWAGESSESVTTQLPLFGDTERNFVDFYEPPSDFQDDWLKPLPSYAAGAAIAAKYKKLGGNYYRKGFIALADFATLHSSHREPGSEPRASIDTTFVLKKKLKPGEKEKIHQWRDGERADHKVLMGIGETHLFVFPDTVDQKVDSEGGFKHPTNLKIVEVLRHGN
ncbi:MAG: hypothetical protein Q7S98_00115 [Deltaproteobacteria bacterium]|nr:hypothetical protein [Deltaproteobacteria bacterium]